MNLWDYYTDYQVIKNGRKVGLKDKKTGYNIIPAQFSAINVACPQYADQVSFIKVKEDNKYFLCDFQGKRITEKFDYIGDYNCGLVDFIQGTKLGFMDENGNKFITPKYTGAEKLDFGKFKVKSRGKWGIVDKRGEIVKPQFDNIVVHDRRTFGIKNGQMIRLFV